MNTTKRLKIMFNQSMYDPVNRVITYQLLQPKSIKFVREHTDNDVVLKSEHTGNRRKFNYHMSTQMPDCERHVYINSDMNVKLYIDIAQ